MTFGPPRRDGLTAVPGGVTAASGFLATGLSTGAKPSGRPDLALVASQRPATAAITTTTNLVKAAPCVVTEEHAADGSAQAVVLNSGNANACTGTRGLDDARAMTAAVAAALDVPPRDVLVCSTGIIGVPLDRDRLLDAVPRLVKELDVGGGPRAAQAITTTDSAPKEAAYLGEDGSGACTVGGMAKGAGMIEPSMATMLAVITTDAPLAATVLRPIVRQAVDRTFNRISVDACGSTNDTVIVLANGEARTPPSLATFRVALEAVCADLAHAIVADGEGTTKVVELTVRGARSETDAVQLARAVARSVLFRAALHGADPNWGRILAAMGTAGVDFDPDAVEVTFVPQGRPEDGVTVCRFGTATAFDRGQAATILSRPAYAIVVDLGLGAAEASYLTADLTPEYVAENAYYTT